VTAAMPVLLHRGPLERSRLTLVPDAMSDASQSRMARAGERCRFRAPRKPSDGRAETVDWHLREYAIV
jgi:hypothetical protein